MLKAVSTSKSLMVMALVSDEVGNLDGLEPNLRQGIGLDDPFSWNWPTDLTEDGGRTSLIRL